MTRRAQIYLLGALLALLAGVYLYRDQLGVIVADTAEKYWKLPPAGEPYRYVIQDAATAWGVPFDLIARDLWQESRFNPKAVNARSGAEGIAQLLPRYFPGVDVLDPAQAIPDQAQALHDHYDRFGSWSLALAAYDWGEGNVHKALTDHGPEWLLYAPPETRKYVGQILTDVPLEPLPVGAMV